MGGRSVVCKEVEQHVAILEDEAKFFKLLELLGLYSQMGSIIVFVDKQENADSLLKDLMKASYSCMSLHGGEFLYLYIDVYIFLFILGFNYFGFVFYFQNKVIIKKIKKYTRLLFMLVLVISIICIF